MGKFEYSFRRKFKRGTPPWKTLVRRQKLKKRLLLHLSSNPNLTPEEFSELHGYDIRECDKAADELVDAGILVEN